MDYINKEAEYNTKILKENGYSKKVLLTRKYDFVKALVQDSEKELHGYQFNYKRRLKDRERRREHNEKDGREENNDNNNNNNNNNNTTKISNKRQKVNNSDESS